MCGRRGERGVARGRANATRGCGGGEDKDDDDDDVDDAMMVSSMSMVS